MPWFNTLNKIKNDYLDDSVAETTDEDGDNTEDDTAIDVGGFAALKQNKDDALQ